MNWLGFRDKRFRQIIGAQTVNQEQKAKVVLLILAALFTQN